MTTYAIETQRADAIYRFGPETLVARAYAIYAGPVARYSKQATEMSQPGPDGYPLKWVVSGRLEQPTVLKGTPPSGAVVPFIRPEQSGMLPAPPSVAAWERESGDLAPGDDAVLFFQGDPAKPALTVLPSRGGAHGLAALVHDIVAIQALAGASAQANAWLNYLQTAPSDDGRRAALRALLAAPGVTWPALQTVLSPLLAGLPAASGLRPYATGIVAHGVVQERWGAQQADAVDFLCRQFEATPDTTPALQQLLTLKLVLDHLSDEATAAARRPLRQRILQSVKQRAAASPLPVPLQQQVDQIRAGYASEW